MMDNANTSAEHYGHALSGGIYIPRNKIRLRNKYPKIDGKTTFNDTCSKIYPETEGWMGGILIFLCCHGHPQAVEILEKHESLNHVFSILYSFFLTLNFYIIYDFACGLMKYCMLRSPLLFSRTVFITDSFHGKSHKCASCFKMQHFKKWNPRIADIRDSICESNNNALRKIATTIKFMKVENAMLILKLFLEIKHRLGIIKSNKRRFDD